MDVNEVVETRQYDAESRLIYIVCFRVFLAELRTLWLSSDTHKPDNNSTIFVQNYFFNGSCGQECKHQGFPSENYIDKSSTHVLMIEEKLSIHAFSIRRIIIKPTQEIGKLHPILVILTLLLPFKLPNSEHRTLLKLSRVSSTLLKNDGGYYYDKILHMNIPPTA